MKGYCVDWCLRTAMFQSPDPLCYVKVVMIYIKSIFPNMPSIHYTLAKQIIPVPYICPLFFTSIFLLTFLLLNRFPIHQSLLFKVPLLKCPVSLEMFHGLCCACSMVPSFLC